MKSFLLLLVVVAAVAAYEQPLIHYHSAAGIAQAERIKQFESALDFDGSSRIAGGQSVNAGAHPHLGGLIISLTNGRQSACGSSMLTNTRAVTAAHCWWDGQNQGRQITVVYGSNRLFSGGVRVNTNNVQMHQQYNTRTLHNDIAIIVHGHVGFSNTINRVNIASGNNNFAGQTATAAGYGRIGDNVDISPNQDKRQVNMPVITNAACISTFGPISIISSTLCTSGAGGRSICPGDSGGPLTVGSGNNRVLGGLIITLQSGGQSVCGSSMISNTRAVTAAHCWWDGQNRGRQLTVVYGSNRLFSGGRRINTNNVQMHGSYNTRTLHNDVAVIVHANVGYTNVINRVNLASGSNNFAGQTATAAGYGRTGDNAGIGQNQDKRQVNMPVITNAVCQQTFGSATVIASTLCTSGAGGRSICPGDSGGPLTVGSGNNRQLIGISSFVSRNGCSRGHPAGFARVTSFNSWIRQRM